MHDYWNDPPDPPDAPPCIMEGCPGEPTLTGDEVWKCECGASWAFVHPIEPDLPDDQPEEPIEEYHPPIKVYCPTCKVWTDEGRHKSIDVGEGLFGEDQLTFECCECKKVSTSPRVG